jgi:glycosyltransferase involved in cell wall biosynthesis
MSGSDAPFSVVIPAHNEAGVIVRCLRALIGDAPADALPEVVVVCNGCSDDTAHLARAVSPHIQVIELAQGSKPLALNTGNAAAKATPRFFLDADIVTRFADLAAVAGKLRDCEAQAGAPQLIVDTTDASGAVKAYYRVWCALPYVTDAMIGSGLYGLSAKGLARVGRFPDIISDDGFVRSCFTAQERCSVRADARGQPVGFTMFPPRNLRSLLSIEIRRRAGVEELRRMGLLGGGGRDNSLAQILTCTARPADIAVYLFVKLWARLFLKLRGAGQWRRDESSRGSESDARPAA